MVESITTLRASRSPLLVPLSSSSRSHRVFALSNGILVLVVSDPAEDLAACCISVACGSHSDPEKIPGLAHLIEHMLFKGNKETPEPDLLENYVVSVGGLVNASTTGEHTSFFVQVPTNNTNGRTQQQKKQARQEELPVFDRVLEGMSDMFKAPSFSEAAIQREIHAVNEEHSIYLKSSNKILYHGMRLLSNEAHPFRRFSTGNYQTLKDYPAAMKINLREELFKLFVKGYTADKTTIVLRGPQSVNHLQRLALTYFSDWQKGKNVKGDLNEFCILSDTWTSRYHNIPLFTRETFNCILLEKPASIISSTVRINFPVSFHDRETSKKKWLFSVAWCHLFGDESQGSICAYMKSLRLIDTLAAFRLDLAQGEAVLVLELSLTGQGASDICHILDIIFKFTHQVFCNDNPKNFRHLGKLLSEFASIEKLNYLYRDSNDSPMDEAHKLAKLLMRDVAMVGTEWILRAGPEWGAPFGGANESSEAKLWWDRQGREFIDFVMEHITTDNYNVVFLTDGETVETVAGKTATFETDPNYHFKYCKRNLDLKLTDTVIEALHIPFPNKFLPAFVTNPSYIDTKLHDICRESAESSLSLITKNISDSIPATQVPYQGIETWFKKEKGKDYNSKCFITMEISSLIANSPEVTTCLELLCEMVSMEARIQLYPAEILSYTWELLPCTKSGCNVTVRVSGFTEGVGKVLLLLLTLLRFQFSVRTFVEAKENIEFKLEKIKEESGIVLGTMALLLLTEQDVWDYEIREDHLQMVSYDDVQMTLNRFFNQTSIKVLYQGDITVDNVKENNYMIRSNFHSSSSVPVPIPTSTYFLHPGNYHYSSFSSSQDPTNTITTYIQTGLRSNAYDRALTNLNAYLISLNLVQELRGEKQLGYAVIGGLRILRKTIGLHIAITSADYRPEVLSEKIDEYLLEQKAIFCNMTVMEFDAEVTKFVDEYLSKSSKLNKVGGVANIAVAAKSTTASSNVGGSACYNSHKILWEKIECGTDDVDLSIITNLKRQEFCEFFSHKISPHTNHRSRISVHLKTQLSDTEVQRAVSLQRWKFWLNLHALSISDDQLGSIIESCHYQDAVIANKLMKYFVTHGASIKITSIMMKETMKSLVIKKKPKKDGITSHQANGSSMLISSITEFHAKLSLV